LGEEGPQKKRTRFTIHNYEGNNLFEIRQFFYKNGDFHHTKKGINLNRDTFMELKRVLDRDEDLILDFLRIGHVSDGILRYQQAQEEAKRLQYRLVGDVEISEVNNFRDKHLFHVRHEGATDVVEINVTHPFAKAISEDEISKMTPREIRGLFARFMAAYARSRTSLLGSGATQPRLLFEACEFDWSEYAAKYLEKNEKDVTL
jgi:hypothetical protein